MPFVIQCYHTSYRAVLLDVYCTTTLRVSDVRGRGSKDWKVGRTFFQPSSLALLHSSNPCNPPIDMIRELRYNSSEEPGEPGQERGDTAEDVTQRRTHKLACTIHPRIHAQPSRKTEPGVGGASCAACPSSLFLTLPQAGPRPAGESRYLKIAVCSRWRWTIPARRPRKGGD